MSNIRRTSEVEGKFPFKVYSNPQNTYMAVYNDGAVKVLGRCKSDEMPNLRIMNDVKANLAKMYISWVGRYRTDVFEVDNIEEMIDANIA